MLIVQESGLSIKIFNVSAWFLNYHNIFKSVMNLSKPLAFFLNAVSGLFELMYVSRRSVLAQTEKVSFRFFAIASIFLFTKAGLCALICCEMQWEPKFL